MPDDLIPCRDCLTNRKPYELDEDGRCAVCDRLAGRAERALPPPPWPTGHMPGTLGKAVVLEWRRENGFDLWHDADARGHAPVETNAHCTTYTVREPRVYRMAAVG